MIFAEIAERTTAGKVLAVLRSEFGEIEWADQGTEESPDAYFWVKQEGVTVAVDNLSSMEFQVKCVHADTPLVREVIDVLRRSFSVKVYDNPELEAHE